MMKRSNDLSNADTVPGRSETTISASDIANIESVVIRHPEVEECALINVKDELGGWDLKLFAKGRKTHQTAADIIEWCATRLPVHHIPRFVAFVDDFEKTSDQCISKAALPKSIDDCYDVKNERRWQALVMRLPIY
jgi:carnitine-CoA ligase